MERTIEVLWNVGGRRYGDPMNVPTAEELARSQADLNEYLAYIIMGESFNELRYVELALEALANHNLAAGFEAEFAGKKPPDDLGGRQRRARAAVNAVHSMDIMSRWDAGRARLSAKQLQRRAPDDAAPLSAAAGAERSYISSLTRNSPPRRSASRTCPGRAWCSTAGTAGRSWRYSR
jgi:hypothetical protein